MFYQISRGAIQVDIRPYPAGMVETEKKKKKFPPATNALSGDKRLRVPKSHLIKHVKHAT